jgi:NADPH:quinone reductase-like Zn-dependent oxidoreductase
MARRWVLPEYSGIDALRLEEFEPGAPAHGEIAIRVTAAGLNPSDYKGLSGGWNADPSLLPLGVGQEAAGVVTAVGEGSEIATGPVSVGDRVVAFKVTGALASDLVVAASDVFALPDEVDDVTAAGLLHVGVVAAELLALSGAAAGETLLIHGASGSVGALAVQLARREGIRVIGTGSESSLAKITSFGAQATTYGPGLDDRVRALAPNGVDAAIDAAATDEALAVSLGLVADRSRVATLAPGPKAREAGVGISAGAAPASIAFRMPQRRRILELAASGELIVPIARTFPMDEAPEALRHVATGHPGGKVVLTV